MATPNPGAMAPPPRPQPLPQPSPMTAPATAPVPAPQAYPPPFQLTRIQLDKLDEAALTYGKWELARQLTQLKGVTIVLEGQMGLFYDSMASIGLRHVSFTDAKTMWSLLMTDVLASLDTLAQQTGTVEMHIRNLMNGGFEEERGARTVRLIDPQAQVTLNQLKGYNVRVVQHQDWLTVVKHIGYIETVSDDQETEMSGNWEGYWAKLLDISWKVTEWHVSPKEAWIDWEFTTHGRSQMREAIFGLLRDCAYANKR